MVRTFPFTAVVGADDVKLALLLAALDPGIGGVLLRGEKGSAKSTLARGLAALLPGSAPFVELPIGATEDRVIGSLDLATALTGGSVELRPGLLAAAHGGVLYVDEVNLLPDHLVDALLDVAASGVNRVEREGVAAAHPARFTLVGSMNPEEGELRPQFLDRFGLSVDVAAPGEPRARAEAVARRLAFDANAGVFAATFAASESALAARVSAAVAAGPAVVPQALMEAVSALALSVGAEGLRADLVICRAAAALARWEGRSLATEEDVRRVAPLALAHRARHGPLDRHGLEPDELEAAMDAAFDPPDEGGFETPGSPEERVARPDEPGAVVRLEAARSVGAPPGGRRSMTTGVAGRLVTDRAPGPDGPSAMAVGATVRAAVARRAIDPDGPLVAPADLREAVREQRAGNLIVLVVDASGSMGAARRMEAAKAAVLGLLVDAYQRRDRVALVTFRGSTADVVLKATGSVEVAQARLTDLPTGGRTPLAAGLQAGLAVAASGGGLEPLLVVVTDGRATEGPEGLDPVEAAAAVAAEIRQRGLAAVVVDAEQGPTSLGLARGLAEQMGAHYLPLAALSAGGLRSVR
jgi:magnesium chelatase subunit D